MNAGKFKRVTLQTILHLVIIILLILLLFPLAMTLWNSFKSELSFVYSRWYPTLPLRYRNYIVAFNNTHLFLLNTIVVAIAGTTGVLFLSSLSAFTFARMKFPGKEVLYSMVIALMMVPGVLTLIPSYMLYQSFGLLNTRWVLIIPIAVGGSIFGTFLLRVFFEGIPEEIFEAARIDGCPEFSIYTKMCLPLSLPILGTLSIMQIVGVWNDFLWPMITIQNHERLTIAAGLLLTLSGAGSPLNFAAYMWASIPLILLFIFANRFFIEGLTSTAIKM